METDKKLVRNVMEQILEKRRVTKAMDDGLPDMTTAILYIDYLLGPAWRLLPSETEQDAEENQQIYAKLKQDYDKFRTYRLERDSIFEPGDSLFAAVRGVLENNGIKIKRGDFEQYFNDWKREAEEFVQEIYEAAEKHIQEVTKRIEIYFRRQDLMKALDNPYYVSSDPNGGDWIPTYKQVISGSPQIVPPINLFFHFKNNR